MSDIDDITAFRSRVANLKEQPEWLEPHQVAKMIGVAPVTLQLWRRKGWGPKPWKQGAGHTRYTSFEVSAYLKSVERGKVPTWNPKTLEFQTTIPLRGAAKKIQKAQQVQEDSTIREERESLERLQRLTSDPID